jgi:hypothetical protein
MLHKTGQPAATRPEDLCGIVGAGGCGGQPVDRHCQPGARGEAQPLGMLTSAAVVLGEKVLVDLAREAVSHVGVEGADLGRRHAARVRGAPQRRGAHEEIDAELGRSNIEIEKDLRRAALKLARANAWLAMARELG